MRPTARGAGVLLGGCVLLAAGFTFGYPELAVLGATAVFAAVCAVAYAALRPSLSVRRSVDFDRVTRGEACTQTLTIGNLSRWRAATLVAQDRCGPQRVPVPLVRLRPAQDTEVAYPVPTQRRGVVDVGPLSVQRRDPLGLVRLSRTHGGTARVWVHPRWYPMAGTPTGVTRSLDGRIDRVPHGSITFDKLREYVIGDELRHVHWRTTARVGQLMVREHVDTSLPRLVVLLDNRAGAYRDPEDFESACEVAASVIAAATRDDLPVQLLLVDTDTSNGNSAVPTNTTGAAPGEASLGPAAAPTGAFTGGRLTGHAGPLLDRLAEATLTPGRAQRRDEHPSADADQADPAPGAHPTGDADPLRQAVNRLRQSRLGDTLVYLTGDGRISDLASVGALRTAYPTIIAGIFGNPEQPPHGVPGLHLFTVPDAPAFAASWDGVGRW